MTCQAGAQIGGSSLTGTPTGNDASFSRCDDDLPSFFYPRELIHGIPRRTDNQLSIALVIAFKPPTIGSASEVASRSIVSFVPGSGRSVKSRSLEKIISPIC